MLSLRAKVQAVRWENLLRVLAFALIFLLCFVTVNRYVTASSTINKDYAWKQIYDVDQPVDVVFMGNSYSYTTINPFIINHALGIHGVTIGSPSENITTSYHCLREILKYKKPKLVVLELHVLQDNYDTLQKNNRGLIYFTLDSMRFGPEKISLASELLQPKYLVEGLLPVTRSLAFVDSITQKQTKITSEEKLLGFTRLSKIPSAQIQKQDPVEWNLTPRLEKEFRNFLNLCKDNGVEVWLVDKPRILYFLSLEPVKAIADEYGVPIIDMNAGPDKVEVNQMMYADQGAHLNAIGSNRCTEVLISHLSQKFQREQQYQNVYAMKNEAVTKGKNGDYTFMVESYAPGASYQFSVFCNKKLIMSTDSSKKNSVTFTPKEKGTYTVSYIARYSTSGKTGKFASRFCYSFTQK